MLHPWFVKSAIYLQFYCPQKRRNESYTQYKVIVLRPVAKKSSQEKKENQLINLTFHHFPFLSSLNRCNKIVIFLQVKLGVSRELLMVIQ